MTTANVSIYHSDNLKVLHDLKAQGRVFDLIYIDPPFNTGKKQVRRSVKVRRSSSGDRIGFKGARYATTSVGSKAYDDAFGDYFEFMRPRLQLAHELLSSRGSLFVHLDYREAHYIKVMLDKIFGPTSFMNEIIWAFDYGARSKRKWPSKHQTIFWYAKNPDDYTFNLGEVDRIAYMAPTLVGAEKAALGKTPTDVWWHTIVSPTGKEKTGYPTQKPLGIMNRIVKVHSNKGEALLDFFAGSGSFGEAAASLGRHVDLVDSNEAAIEVMMKRLDRFSPVIVSAKAAVGT